MVATTVELDAPLEDLAFCDLLISHIILNSGQHAQSQEDHSWALGLRGSASQAEEAWLVRCFVFTGVLWSYYPFVNS